MMITIQQALHPLLLTFAVLGFGVYFPMKIYLNIFYNLTIWIVYIYLYFYLTIEFKAVWNLEISTVFNTLISMFSIIISIIMNIHYNQKFQISIKRLAAVDNTLEKLGTPKTYHKLYTYVKRVLIGWLVSVNLVNITDIICIWWNGIEDRRNLILPYFSNCHFHVNMFMDLLLATLLWHLHLELCQIARELNRIFGIQMTMEIINCMICFMRYCWFLYLNMRVKFVFFSSIHWLNIQIWLFLHGIRLFCLNYSCESVSTKANKMEEFIHHLTDFLRYADVHDEIYQFTLQMVYHPLKFTGLGLFHFGNGFLRRLIMRLITFVILIIQMATIPQSMYKFLKERNITITSR